MALRRDVIAQIPLPAGKINLNAGTLSPTPAPVAQRADELRRMAASNPSDFCWRQLPGLIQASRTALADYVNVPADELLLLPNVTFAINIVISSLQLPAGTEILLTDHEYGSMVYTWERWAAARDWTLKKLSLPIARETTQEQLIELFDQAMTPSTRVVFLYHVSSPTGLVLPVKEICALARERHILTVVDGAHGPGMIPVDLAEIGADYYGSNTHKWLMGPNSGGFLHVARPRRLDVKPIITAWGWQYNRSEAFEDSGNGGSKWQWDVEFHGTIDRVPEMTVPEQLAFRRAVGSEADIRAYTFGLAAYAREVIPMKCVVPDDERLRAALTIFELPEMCEPNDLRDRLYHDFGIEAPITVTAGRQFLRVSTAMFNTQEDVDALASAVRQMWKL